MLPCDIGEVLARHEHIALQMSGGKDSLACLHLLKPYLDRITVYWCNTGDAFPETVEQMARICQEVPNFVEIEGRQPQVIRQFGLPSDIVPTGSTPFGRMVGHHMPAIQDRYACCFMSVMQPMHERMLADGITLIIRGQRADDAQKAPIQSGCMDAGIEYLFPIESWSEMQVREYLAEHNVPMPRFYATLREAPDCTTCSAWWETGASSYRKEYHPAAHEEVQRRLDIINAAVAPSIAAFNREIGS